MAVLARTDAPLEFAEILRYGLRAGYTVLDMCGSRAYQINAPPEDWPKPKRYELPSLGE